MSYDLTIREADDWLHATVTGNNSIRNVEDYLQEIFQATRETDFSKLLIEERLEGPRLGTIEVFKVASKRAEESRGRTMIIAYVDIYAEGDLMAFAETVAKNRGSRVRVFANVAEAEEWLASAS